MWIMWTSTVVHRPMFRHKCVWEMGNKGYLVGGDLTILKSMSSSMGGMTSIFYYGNKTWSKPPTRVYISGRNDLSNLLPRAQHSVVPHRLWGFQYWGITNGVSVVRVVPYRLWRFSATSERGRPRRSKTKLVLQSFCRLLIYIYIWCSLETHTGLVVSKWNPKWCGRNPNSGRRAPVSYLSARPGNSQPDVLSRTTINSGWRCFPIKTSIWS